MNRPFEAVATVLRKELVDALRDRRTLLTVLASSVLMGPLILVAISGLVASLEARAEQPGDAAGARLRALIGTVGNDLDDRRFTARQRPLEIGLNDDDRIGKA